MTKLLLTIKNELYARQTCENSKVEKEPELPFLLAALHANQNQIILIYRARFVKKTIFLINVRKWLISQPVENIFVILGVVLCVLDQDIKFQNAQAQKCVIIAMNDIILLYVKREKGISTNLSVKENTSISLQTAVVLLTNKNNSKSVKGRVF